MPELPSLDQLHDLQPDDVLAAIAGYIQQDRVDTGDWDIFQSRPDTEMVPYLELTNVPMDQFDPDEGHHQSQPVLLLLAGEDEESGEFADEAKRQILAGQCAVEGLGNGRFMVVGDGGDELALLTLGRGVTCRPEDFLDHGAGCELRDADGPPVSMRIYGDIHRPLPGHSPENQIDLICEAIETRGGPTDQTSVLVDVTPWSIVGARVSLPADLIERMSRNRVSVSITAIPFTGRRKTLQVEPIPDGFEIPEPDVHQFYETLRREANWLRTRGPAPSWVPGCWTWLVETDLGWYLVDGDEEPRATGFGGPLL